MAEKEEVQELTVKKSEDFSEWYNQIVQKAKLADYSAIAGCMVIRPYAYSMWEKIQDWLDTRFKETGCENAYFPIFIPERFLKKEAEHFEGFSPEVAWVEQGDDKEERYALRPTSETIMYDTYSKWIRSWRDLPLRINQWCNIIRWEVKATRLFLRTREFLWQEGHTAHSTMRETEEEVMLRARQYRELIESQLAIAVVVGKKSKNETFPGAEYTVALEALMPDGKALQMCTSHNLGQHFGRVFGISYTDRDMKEKIPYQTSWGITTRLIGALVMAHGDDRGLVLPPRVAPAQIVIVPIYDNSSKKNVLKEAKKIEHALGSFRVKLDARENTPGWKFNEWEMMGVPLRIEIGPKDIKKKQVVFVRRDTGEKSCIKWPKLEKEALSVLDSVQSSLLRKSRRFLKNNTEEASSLERLKKLISQKKMVRTSWCGYPECETRVKDETAATIRVIEKENKAEGKCAICGKKGKHTVLWAKAY